MEKISASKKHSIIGTALIVVGTMLFMYDNPSVHKSNNVEVSEKQNIVFANNVMSAVQKTQLIPLMVQHNVTSLSFYRFYPKNTLTPTMNVQINSVYNKKNYQFIDNNNIKWLNSILRKNNQNFITTPPAMTVTLKSTQDGKLYLNFTNMQLDNTDDVNFNNFNQLLKNPEVEKNFIKNFNTLLKEIKFEGN